MNRIDEIRARWKDVTPGEWSDSDGYDTRVYTQDRFGTFPIADMLGGSHMWTELGCDDEAVYQQMVKNAKAVANSKQDIAFLLSTIDAQQAELERVTRERDAAGQLIDQLEVSLNVCKNASTYVKPGTGLWNTICGSLWRIKQWRGPCAENGGANHENNL